MGFADAVAAGFRGFATYRGRARRSEFWWFQLFAAAAWVLTMLAVAPLWLSSFSGEARPSTDPAIDPESIGFASLTLAAGILALTAVVIGLPALAVTARRLHDVDMSAWWLLLSVAGLGIVLLLTATRRGTEGANRFGPDPLVSVDRPADRAHRAAG